MFFDNNFPLLVLINLLICTSMMRAFDTSHKQIRSRREFWNFRFSGAAWHYQRTFWDFRRQVRQIGTVQLAMSTSGYK